MNSKRSFILPLLLLSFSLCVSACTNQNPPGEDPTPVDPVDPEDPVDPVDPEDPEDPEEPEDPVDPPEEEILSYGEKAKKAVDNNLEFVLSSKNVVSKGYVISTTDTVKVAKIDNGEIKDTSKSFSEYYVSKGMATDGENIYTILNAKTGSTKDSGFDVGIIAKVDVNGKILAHTPYAFHWGNIPRLSYYDGKLYVTRTSNPSSSDYGADTNFTSYVLKFDAETLSFSNRYLSEEFSIPAFVVSDAGNLDMISANKDNTQCALIYKNESVHTLYTYQKNESGVFEKVADGVTLQSATDGETTSNSCYDLYVADNYVYTMWSIAKGGVIRVSDLQGNIILDKTVDNAEEGTHTKKNYQGLVEIDKEIYYSTSDWSADKKGFMLFKVTASFPSETIVTFDANGADVNIPRQILSVNSKVVKPEDPSYSYTDKRGKVYNFVFENWYLGETVWDFDNDIVTQDMTLKAKYTYQDSFFDIDEHASERTNGSKARVMSFNVLSSDWNNKPVVDDTRVNQAFDTIERYQPDVISFQEFDNNWYTKASTFLNGYTLVNKDNITIGTTVNYTTLAYNNETVALLEYKQVHLPTCSTKKCRNVTIAAFEFIKGNNAGEQFIVSNTHWNLKETERIQQASETYNILSNFQAKYPSVPLVATGDFNSYDTYESIATFKSLSGYSDAKEVTLAADVVCDTYHIGNPMREGKPDYSNPDHCYRGPESFSFKNVQTESCIDHIFVPSNVTVLFYNTVHDSVVLNASDHCPIYIDFTF